MEHPGYQTKRLLKRAASTRHGVPAEASRLLQMKKLEPFDLSFQQNISRKVVRELACLAFVECSENVILQGPPAEGKTHLVVALGVKAANEGHRVPFMPLDKLIAALMKTQQEIRLDRHCSNCVLRAYCP